MNRSARGGGGGEVYCALRGPTDWILRYKIYINISSYIFHICFEVSGVFSFEDLPLILRDNLTFMIFYNKRIVVNEQCSSDLVNARHTCERAFALNQ